MMPEIEPTLTMAPPLPRMWRATATLHFHTALTLRSKTASHSPLDTSQALVWKHTPALFTRMSMLPSTRSAPSTIVSTSPSAVMSALMGLMSSPSPTARLCAAAFCSSSRPAITTRAPASASARAVASPMPRLPPVTSAVLPVSWNFSRTLTLPPTVFELIRVSSQSTLRQHEPSYRREHELLHGLGEAVVFVGGRDPPGGALDLRVGVPHGDTQAGVGEHQDVVGHVPDSGDLFGAQLVP